MTMGDNSFSVWERHHISRNPSEFPPTRLQLDSLFAMLKIHFSALHNIVINILVVGCEFILNGFWKYLFTCLILRNEITQRTAENDFNLDVVQFRGLKDLLS